MRSPIIMKGTSFYRKITIMIHIVCSVFTLVLAVAFPGTPILPRRYGQPIKLVLLRCRCVATDRVSVPDHACASRRGELVPLRCRCVVGCFACLHAVLPLRSRRHPLAATVWSAVLCVCVRSCPASLACRDGSVGCVQSCPCAPGATRLPQLRFGVYRYVNF